MTDDWIGSVMLTMITRRLLVGFVGVLTVLLVGVGGLSVAPGRYVNKSLLSRIENAQCEIQMSVGRIPGTAMPPEWAASGAKLALNLELEFTKNDCADYEMTKERLLGTGRPTFRAVEPLLEPTFVSAQGQQSVKVTEGAYGCDIQQLEAQLYAFRFFLDFPNGAIRNDVELPAERIYFMTQCWIKDERSINRAKGRKVKIEKSLDEINQNLAEWQSAGDNNNILKKVMGIRQSVLDVERKTLLETQLTELDKTYPLGEATDLVSGPYDTLFVKEGVIAVKRFRGAMGTKEQYHWVGTFTIKEFFADLEDENED